MVALPPPALRYWNRKTETMPRADLAAWQWRKLQLALARARDNSPFWRSRLPADVGSIEEYFARTPLLYKSDLIAAQQAAPPDGEFPSTDPSLAIRHHQTSGAGRGQRSRAGTGAPGGAG